MLRNFERDTFDHSLRYRHHALPLAFTMILSTKFYAGLLDYRQHFVQMIVINSREKMVRNMLIEACKQCH
jgi:hypothetical protein